jgi:dipeptidyl aminopeptidase/acylaminoacyl peptidase
MEKALFKAHKAVELVLIDLEGHSFILPPTRLKLFNQLERFLSVHIGN